VDLGYRVRVSREPRLYAESFAPFCERARWALDHHGLRYREIEQVPLLAEITLRLAARRLRGPVTVPLLVTEGRTIMDSHAIARWADERGTGAPLFPEADEVDRWMAVSDAIMASGRALLLDRLSTDVEALAEQLPPGVPAPLRRPLSGSARLGVVHLRRKYATRERTTDAHETALRGRLEEVRARITGRSPGLFSYADITLATSLQFVLPVADAHIHLGPASRRAWTHAGLAEEFADVLAWRDETYAAFRRRG
jgi:glutathione S-transferase